MRLRRLKFLVGVAFLATLFGAVVVDERMKLAPHAGYGPAGAVWRFTCRDFPRFWQAVESSPPFKAFTMEWPSPLREIEVAVRRATGVRPTQARWRLWMGRELMATGDGHHAPVFCVRPGLLLHLAHALRPAFNIRRDGDLFRINLVWYAWHQGYLLFSTDRNAVATALAAPSSWPREASEKDEARLDWLQEPRTSITLKADDVWRATGTVAAPFPHREEDMGVHNAWPDAPMLVISAQDMSQALRLPAPWRHASDSWAAWMGVDGLLNRIDAAMGPAYGAPGPCSIAVFDFERSAQPPTPQWGALTRYHDGATSPSLDPPTATVPVLDGAWSLTIDPPAMLDPMATAMRAGNPVQADILISLDWSKLAADLEEALTVGNEAGVFASVTKKDLEGYWIPMVRGLGALGRLHLEVRGGEAVTSLEGYLAKTP